MRVHLPDFLSELARGLVMLGWRVSLGVCVWGGGVVTAAKRCWGGKLGDQAGKCSLREIGQQMQDGFSWWGWGWQG